MRQGANLPVSPHFFYSAPKPRVPRPVHVQFGPSAFLAPVRFGRTSGSKPPIGSGSKAGQIGLWGTSLATVRKCEGRRPEPQLLDDLKRLASRGFRWVCRRPHMLDHLEPQAQARWPYQRVVDFPVLSQMVATELSILGLLCFILRGPPAAHAVRENRLLNPCRNRVFLSDILHRIYSHRFARFLN